MGCGGAGWGVLLLLPGREPMPGPRMLLWLPPPCPMGTRRDASGLLPILFSPWNSEFQVPSGLLHSFFFRPGHFRNAWWLCFFDGVCHTPTHHWGPASSCKASSCSKDRGPNGLSIILLKQRGSKGRARLQSTTSRLMHSLLAPDCQGLLWTRLLPYIQCYPQAFSTYPTLPRHPTCYPLRQ